ncbi:MAG: type III-A CRISPR-associated RAMP protein Csm4, partial [Candidatus Brocadiales bacterium]
NTVGEDSLYEVEEQAIETEYLSIYVRTTTDWKDKVADLFEAMSKVGFGKDKSTGKGHFKYLDMERFESFNSPDDSNGFVTLSNFVPAKADPTEGLYKTFVKYGKLGEEFSLQDIPFKKPLVMFSEGSVFYTGNTPQKDSYGRMMFNIALRNPEVVQYALAFPVPLKYPQESKNA